QRRFDLPVLAAAEGAPFNVLHVCGADTLFEEFVDYPVQAFSWAPAPGNPTLREGHRRTGRAVLGGLPAKPEFARLTPAAVAERAWAAVADMGGRSLLLGPGCSIDPETPDPLLHAARAAILSPREGSR
ncbi:MAG TPA: uroporphyrinogen decarboxylase, partial [Candidatus Tectomicrobia bacterium]|nr:uroporphyrinogen decarboxylase [Candidatus Tectomicrobia bacterium]